MVFIAIGSTLFTHGEMEKLTRQAREAGIKVIVSPGPRRNWNLGSQSKSRVGRAEISHRKPYMIKLRTVT